MRTVEWDAQAVGVRLIDQRLLPNQIEYPVYTDYAAVGRAITDMVVRGAPAIGATAAYGLALAGFQSRAGDVVNLRRDVQQAADVLRAARPTAVNLGWALDRLLRVAAQDSYAAADDLRQALLAEAQTLADEDVALNRRMGFNGAALVQDGDTIIHHCNTGALAAVDFGTALGVIFAAHEQGKEIHVLVDETRPRLQGARLTAWELEQKGISFELIADNAAGFFLKRGEAQLCLVGADRVTANGDVANKIGTYPLAVVARENGVPFYSVVPTSTIDLSLAHGDLIPIERRDPHEVLGLEFAGQPVAPAGARQHGRARNPAFDVTPARYLTGIITENGVARPPYTLSLARAVAGTL
ncbi:MAG: S-methyl-5-thioribose-1-phosphate isomerase [Anaerolineales bacterium]|nr:S-methyl-5-thioribose-1-phosphate isomerase [Anaerolineales bacterium]